MKANTNNIALQAHGITKRFGGLVAVNSVDMHVYEHEILGLIGSNGAGKTTMFNLLSGTLPATEGHLTYYGTDIKRPTPHGMARMGIGRTYQICQPFGNMTVCENVMVGAFLRTHRTEEARERAMAVLNRVGLAARANVQGSALTLPELKRMEVARALATEPKILLLDEVLAGLNPTECDKLIEMIHGLREEGITIIIIEHIMRAIMNLSDRIYVMNQGKKIAEGEPQEVANNQAVIDSYLGGGKHA